MTEIEKAKGFRERAQQLRDEALTVRSMDVRYQLLGLARAFEALARRAETPQPD
jgi:hypothetical protein